ncbi:hypothetical protein SCAR479_01392 [Seiridium cardinale]|uniref:Thaumatin-like protein n=1 Tax=Seiridium cardinale TaxID=138064 RepID=A0ABR2Y5N2_9PEZI
MHSSRVAYSLLCLAVGFVASQNSTDDTGPVPGDDGPGATITNETSSLVIPVDPSDRTAGPGQAIVVNKCSSPVYLWSVSADKTSAVHELEANGGRYVERMHAPSTGGVSMKVHKTRNDGNIPACTPDRWDCHLTQFEYTLVPDQNKVYYDISFVNCAQGKDAGNCPGHASGVTVECANGNNKNCPVQHCAPGAFCPHEVYYHCGAPCNTPDPTKATGKSRDLVYTLCTGN